MYSVDHSLIQTRGLTKPVNPRYERHLTLEIEDLGGARLAAGIPDTWAMQSPALLVAPKMRSGDRCFSLPPKIIAP